MAGQDEYERSWLRLSDGFIGGIHHALNNRMAALGGAVQVLEGDLPSNHPLVGALSGEIQRLEATTGLLRLLRGDDEGFAAIQIEEVLGHSRRLFEVHPALRDCRLNIEIPVDLLPLRTAPAELLRTLLLMLATSARSHGVADGEVSMSIRGDETWIRIGVEVGEPGVPTGELPDTNPAAMTAAAGRLGGEFEVLDESSAGGWELRLPTLLEVRRRESA